MKISLNWVKEFTKLDLPVDKLAEKIGAQLGAVEKVEDLGAKYKGIVVAKVVACQSHPNADKLSLCLIDDGGAAKGVRRDQDGHIQVVCGAPNVRRDQMVAWCPPGAVVPSTIGQEPLILSVRDLRGHKSYGMLLSGFELGINSDQAGILEIDEPAKPGMPLAKVYGLDDYIIEIENKMFTHRPDCFGVLGVARELAGIQGQAFKSPDWYLRPRQSPIPNSKLPLEVRNESRSLCPRFTAVTIAGVSAGPSPLWLQTKLFRLGVKPINNIVDLTNYYMILTGQPLHAYDYDKLKAQSSKPNAEIVVRRAKAGETLKVLGGKVISLRSDDIVITDGRRPIGLAGVIGGSDTEVSEHTQNLVLESANFERHAIHRTAMAHGLFTEAGTRFSKQRSPQETLPVLLKASDDLIKLTGGSFASDVIDQKAEVAKPALKVDAGFINSRLGLDLNALDMARLLKNVEFNVNVKEQTFRIEAPFWRTDINIVEDVIEEVGRLYGYDHLPLSLPRRDLKPAAPDPVLNLKLRLRSLMAGMGANETLSYSFVHGNLLTKVGQDPAEAFQIANALSPDLQYYRLSLLPSLLELIHPNQKAGYTDFALFEINKAHHKSLASKTAPPVEEERLALVVAADAKTAQANYHGAAYFQAAKYLSQLLADLGIRPLFVPFKDKNYRSAVLSAAMAPFEPTRSAYVLSEGGELLGLVGEFKPAVLNGLKLPAFSAGFELNILQLLKAQSREPSYVIRPRFPAIEQDICLRVKTAVSYQRLFDFVWDQLLKQQPANVYSTLTPVDIYLKSKEHKQITLRLTIASYERTLETTAVNELLDKIARAAKSRLAAIRI